jgi:hypothetical protein
VPVSLDFKVSSHGADGFHLPCYCEIDEEKCTLTVYLLDDNFEGVSIPLSGTWVINYFSRFNCIEIRPVQRFVPRASSDDCSPSPFAHSCTNDIPPTFELPFRAAASSPKLSRPRSHRRNIATAHLIDSDLALQSRQVSPLPFKNVTDADALPSTHSRSVPVHNVLLEDSWRSVFEEESSPVKAPQPSPPQHQTRFSPGEPVVSHCKRHRRQQPAVIMAISQLDSCILR